MNKLLIADDEKMIRESICRAIDWKSLDISLVGAAKDGLEAYSIYLDKYPDIILTDIRMPGLSGLDLIGRIHNINEDTQFIILSGYSEFEYAKQAMRYGVRQYLLKPCSEEQIIEAVQEAKIEYGKLKQEHSADDWLNPYRTHLYNYILCDIVRKYLASEGETVSSESEEHYYDAYDSYIESGKSPYDVFYLYFIDEREYRSDIPKIEQLLKNLVPDIRPGFFYVHCTLVLFFQHPTQEAVDTIEMNLRAEYYTSGELETSLRHQIYSCLKDMLREVVGKMSRFNMVSFTAGGVETHISNSVNILRNVRNLSVKLFSADAAESEEAISALKDIIGNCNSLFDLRQIIASVILNASGSLLSTEMQHLLEKLYQIERNDSVKVVRNECIAVLNEIGSQRKKRPSSSSVSDRIILCVNENLQNPDLSLKWIAEHSLYMNVDYLSRCFVKETGKRFSSYIAEVRVKKAETILRSHPSSNIADVAEEVGYGNNPQYFSQIFRKVAGQTPKNYVKALTDSV